MQDKQQEKEILKFLSYFINYYNLNNYMNPNILLNWIILNIKDKTDNETELKQEIKRICNYTIKEDKLNYPLFQT